MKKYLYLLLFIFIANSLNAQKLEVGLAFPVLTSSSRFSEIAASEGELFYGVGIKTDLLIKFDNSNLFIKPTLNICSYQSFINNKSAFFNISFNTFLDYLIYENIYSGIGMAVHNYSIAPSTEIIQSSVSGNLGFFVLDNYYFDLIYNYMFNDNQMKNFNVLFFSIGYKF